MYELSFNDNFELHVALFLVCWRQGNGQIIFSIQPSKPSKSNNTFTPNIILQNHNLSFESHIAFSFLFQVITGVRRNNCLITYHSLLLNIVSTTHLYYLLGNM